jgi:chorismate mutase
MKNLKLKLIRQKIDKLDDKLLNLIKIRTNLVTGVLKQKRYKNQIVDKLRIKQILMLIKKKSISRKIDPKLTKRIWKNMILAYIDFEKRNFKKK